MRLESLKDELCRFCLIGPKSHQVIMETLHPADSSSVYVSENLADDADTGQQVCGEGKHSWWDDYIASESGSSETTQQASCWKKLSAVQNAAELPPFSVHGLTVRDPRLFLPHRRTLVSHSICREYSCFQLLFFICPSM